MLKLQTGGRRFLALACVSGAKDPAITIWSVGRGFSRNVAEYLSGTGPEYLFLNRPTRIMLPAELEELGADAARARLLADQDGTRTAAELAPIAMFSPWYQKYYEKYLEWSIEEEIGKSNNPAEIYLPQALDLLGSWHKSVIKGVPADRWPLQPHHLATKYRLDDTGQEGLDDTGRALWAIYTRIPVICSPHVV